MSRSYRISRVSSDFSIERILSEDRGKNSGENPPDVSSNVNVIVPRMNIHSCPRLQFNNEEQGNTSNSQSVIDCSGISRVTSVTVPTSLATSSNRDTNKGSKIQRDELSWLHCTRYRPPKLPRKSSSGNSAKRKPGAHPRIPFTTIQLQILEDKYRSTAYLSRRDVVQLSSMLKLPQSRVKIWFQNRRARDRRETGISGGNITIVSDEESQAHNSLNSPNEKSSSTNSV